MNSLNETRRIGESIVRGKAIKQELSYQIDTLNEQEFLDLMNELDNNSKIEFPEYGDAS